MGGILERDPLQLDRSAENALAVAIASPWRAFN
jgi:hypothetical protein